MEKHESPETPVETDDYGSPVVTIPHNRQEVLETIQRQIDAFQEEKSGKRVELVEKIVKRREDFRNKFPRAIRWMIPHRNEGDAFYEVKVNRAGMTGHQYIDYHYEDYITEMEGIRRLCHRSTGETIFLSEHETTMLTLELPSVEEAHWRAEKAEKAEKEKKSALEKADKSTKAKKKG